MTKRMPFQPAAGLLVLASLQLSACAAEPDELVVDYDALTATEVLRIGSVDDPETALTDISALRVADDGRIYTLHRQDRAVRVHGPDGAPMGSFGGDGEGPGEFRSPNAMEVFDDEVVVFDFRTLRTTYFDLDGEFLRTIRYEPPDADDPIWSQVRPNGLLRGGQVHSAPRRTTAPGWEDHPRSPLLRLSEDGSTQDTILHFSLDELLVLESGELPMVAIQPFAGSEVLDISGRRMEIAVVDRHRGESPRFRVSKMSVEGDTLWRREYAFEPVAYPASVVDSFVTAMDDFMIERSGATRAEIEAEMRSQITPPPHLPVARRVLVGTDGSVWIELADRDPIETRWLALEAEGDPVGIVTFAEGVLLREVALDEVWARVRDELDVPYIVKYEISPGG